MTKVYSQQILLYLFQISCNLSSIEHAYHHMKQRSKSMIYRTTLSSVTRLLFFLPFISVHSHVKSFDKFNCQVCCGIKCACVNKSSKLEILLNRISNKVTGIWLESLENMNHRGARKLSLTSLRYFVPNIRFNALGYINIHQFTKQSVKDKRNVIRCSA